MVNYIEIFEKCRPGQLEILVENIRDHFEDTLVKKFIELSVGRDIYMVEFSSMLEKTYGKNTDNYNINLDRETKIQESRVERERNIYQGIYDEKLAIFNNCYNNYLSGL